MKLLALLLLASSLQAASWRWWASVAAVGAANAADILTTRGHLEVNPLLRGPNGMLSSGRVVAFKIAPQVGVLVLERLVLRRQEKAAIIINLGMAGANAAVAYRNRQQGGKVHNPCSSHH